MAGYDGYSKSNNALDAEDNGIFPLTHAVRIVAGRASVTQKAARAALKELGPSEWHHTSKFYTRVSYYDTRAAVCWLDAREAVAALEAADYETRISAGLATGTDIDSRRAGAATVYAALNAETGIDTGLIETAYYESWSDRV